MKGLIVMLLATMSFVCWFGGEKVAAETFALQRETIRNGELTIEVIESSTWDELKSFEESKLEDFYSIEDEWICELVRGIKNTKNAFDEEYVRYSKKGKLNGIDPERLIKKVEVLINIYNSSNELQLEFTYELMKRSIEFNVTSSNVVHINDKLKDGHYTVESIETLSWKELKSAEIRISKEDEYLGQMVERISETHEIFGESFVNAALEVNLDCVNKERLIKEMEALITVYNEENELQLEIFTSSLDEENEEETLLFSVVSSNIERLSEKLKAETGDW